ncbi:zinc finger protein 436 [Culicoides brevitarsis]|uniref:zinc finger protein 436 n=1 Tax=Culicoides brevitarsis TaxID=469753 RepID=UPI00307C70CE
MASSQYRVQSKVVGLLTTINSLPPSYKSHYNTANSQQTSSNSANNHHFVTDHSYSEYSPLDLSRKPIFQPLVPLITPPSTPSPLKKRYRELEFRDENTENKPKIFKAECQVTIKPEKTEEIPIQKKELEKTPNKPVKGVSAHKSSKNPPLPTKDSNGKKAKASRKLKFDEWQSSPVSGTIIRPLEEITGNTDHQSGDIDPEYNIVEATDEARAEIATIPNVIGDYKCKLCRTDFEDVFELARHRCSCIVLLEYRCPECGKKFNCPANLASHRRWHKPRDQVSKKSESSSDENQFPCTECNKSFKRMAYLKKHQATHKNPKNIKLKTDPARQRLISHSDDSYSKDSNYSTTSSSVNNNNYGQFGAKSIPTMSDIVFNFTKAAAQQRIDEDESSCSSEDSNRLQIIADRFTEDENIAAAALAHLRHGSSVIKHTTALHAV